MVWYGSSVGHGYEFLLLGPSGPSVPIVAAATDPCSGGDGSDVVVVAAAANAVGFTLDFSVVTSLGLVWTLLVIRKTIL